MPSIENLRKAVIIAEQIEKLQSQLNSLIQGGPAPILPPAVKLPAAITSKPAKKKKGGISAAGRAAIVAAQKARWAKIKKEKGEKAAPVKAPAAKAAPSKTEAKPAKAAKPEKKKRNVSPEVRAKLAAMMKARWAAKKTSAQAPVATKKKK